MVRIVSLGRGKERAPLYCLPTASGSVNAYADMAAALAPDHAVYGIELADRSPTGAGKLYPSLREIAGVIAPNLLAHCHDGPVGLVGYSFAGHLAVHLAQVFERRGRRVSLLALIDTMPSWSSFSRTFRLRNFATYVGPWLLNSASGFVPGERLWWKYRALLLKLRRQHMFEEDDWFRDLTRERQAFLLNNLSLSYGYAFEGEYRGRILLLRPEREAYGSPLRTGQLPDFGWQRVTGADVRVASIPGDHATCLAGANAIALANALRLACKDCDLAPASARGEPQDMSPVCGS